MLLNLLESSQSDALCHTLVQQVQATGGENTDERRREETSTVFVTLTEGNSGKIYKNRLETKRRKRSSVKCYLRPQMNVRRVKCTLLSGYTLNRQ